LDVGREEESKYRSDHHDQEHNSRLFRPIPIRDPTGDDEAKDLTRTSSVGQTRLPCRGDLIFFVLFVPVAVFLVENRRSVEVAEKREIVALFETVSKSERQTSASGLLPMMRVLLRRTDHPIALGYVLIACHRLMRCSAAAAWLASTARMSDGRGSL